MHEGGPWSLQANTLQRIGSFNRQFYAPIYCCLLYRSSPYIILESIQSPSYLALIYSHCHGMPKFHNSRETDLHLVRLSIIPQKDLT